MRVAATGVAGAGVGAGILALFAGHKGGCGGWWVVGVVVVVTAHVKMEVPFAKKSELFRNFFSTGVCLMARVDQMARTYDLSQRMARPTDEVAVCFVGHYGRICLPTT